MGCGDLLSDVMANAPDGCIWLTVQTHQNIVPVAVLHEMAAVFLPAARSPIRKQSKRPTRRGC